MISFEKKTTLAQPSTAALPLTQAPEDNRFDEIRRAAAAERSRKADTDGTRRRARQTAEDNRLL